MEKKWKIRDYLELDRMNLIDWRNMIDKRVITQDFFKWLYYDNPFGQVDCLKDTENNLPRIPHIIMPVHRDYYRKATAHLGCVNIFNARDTRPQELLPSRHGQDFFLDT